MTDKKKVLAISGSTRTNSSNERLIKKIAALAIADIELTLFESISELPHFNPDLDNTDKLPSAVIAFRQQIAAADGILICTPEYVFTLPGSLKNALEWCVSTTLFSQKPAGLITASASGEKGHEALQLVMKTIEAKFNGATLLLIKGIKSKIDMDGNITDDKTLQEVQTFTASFVKLLN
ncbi:NAD(P)H-dependent oxidoreductase [Taibaiella lutea]|uniref:NAD(P)H-dependent oxidoreductase n=1 Tax=Taibaiella lutea TaxID=2608001 RepID=A0A5M6CJ61_9BACT|nr:NAD(P)H-dependent oxidoreductase [Taibaiella lutea]KAA5535066.1 NAD(P)H-dependent oxidoreductase [Taibaiella lutea]